MKEKCLRFSVSNNSVTHLGRNLYSTTPPALAELIANSYDAYATEVDIRMTDENVIVADNGMGMTVSGIQDKYALIGRQKKNETPFLNIAKREPMGKKGIGKLASFSIGEKYTVYTKTIDSQSWIVFTLEYNEMIDKFDEEYVVEYEKINSLPVELTAYSKFEHGFIIVIESLIRKAIKSTTTGIENQVSRRFYLSSDFDVKMNGESISLIANEYYSNLNFLIYFGYNKSEIEKNFTSKVKLIEYNNNSDVIDFIKAKNIKGWIGGVLKPSDLKKETADYNNVIVYINGKISDENILKNKGNARIANQYLVGEIQADYFAHEINDPITSSRQGLDDSLESVEEFIKNISIIRNHAINKWDELRNEDAIDSLPKQIKENSSYQEWLNGLDKEQKQTNNKLINLLAPKIDEGTTDEESIKNMLTSIANVINNMEITEIQKALKNEEDMDKTYSLMSNLMNNIAKSEQIKHSELIQSRLSAIDELEILMKNENSSERMFEEHLADNPWLINPYWNVDRNLTKSERDLVTQKYYKTISSSGQEKRNFLDILIHVAEEDYPVIVELKKNTAKDHALVNYTDIYNQIKNYRQAIVQNRPELEIHDEEDIKAYFIISEDAGIGTGNKIELTDKEYGRLNDSNIKVIKYNKLLTDIRRMYKEHLSYLEEQKVVPNFEL